MNDSIANAWYRDLLCCPDCRNELASSDEALICSQCNYTAGVSKPISLKPGVPPDSKLALPRVMSRKPEDWLDEIELERPSVIYDGPRAIRDSRELVSEIQRYLEGQGDVLDLGCGPRDQAVPIAHIGHRYVGLDYSNAAADLLGDGHALPFRDVAFDAVLSYAVLEHLHNPFIAIREIERVLKPGGIYVGTVSQGEPYHASYFHHTAWGFVSLVTAVTRLEIRRLWSSGDTLESLVRMGRYPRAIRYLLGALNWFRAVTPFLAPRKMRWPIRERQLDEIHRAGSICFVVQKPRDSGTSGHRQ